MMSNRMKELLQQYRQEIESISDAHIIKVILYGSYVRGDNKADSDIDIMILVDLKDGNMKKYEDKVIDITYDFNEMHETEIMPIVQNIEHFNRWKNAYMFYQNIDREGVAI